jgi:hypothetical protein
MTSLPWQATGDASEFLAAAGPYPRRERVRNTVRVHVNQRLYRLAELSWPDPAPAGTGRTADDRDVPLLTVLLYTGRANPVSNSIYQRIGYRAVEDRVSLEFTAD